MTVPWKSLQFLLLSVPVEGFHSMVPVMRASSSLTSPTEPASIPLVVQKRKPRARKKKLKWDAMIDLLEDFYERNGHTLVTKEHGDLYKWSVTLRANYRHQVLGDGSAASYRPKLSVEKMRRLDKVEFPWDMQEALWKRRYTQLLEFKTVHGHTRVPANNLEYPGLGVWVRNQRREYRKLDLGDSQPSTLTIERREALEAIGFEWYNSRPMAWEKRYEELKAYSSVHGNSDVPEDYDLNFSLGQWCMNQRTAYRQYCLGGPTAMNSERIRKLEALSFRWSYRDHKWHTMLERLKEYNEQCGHVSISTDDDENQDLRHWVILQRFFYNKRRRIIENGGDGEFSTPLTEKRIDAIEKAVPTFTWRRTSGPKKEDWAKLFDAMREKGIVPGARPKQHWFEGTSLQSIDVKSEYSEQELMELWNMQDSDEDEDDEEYIRARGF